MRSHPYRFSFLFLWLSLFLWTHVSKTGGDRVRSLSVAAAFPAWKMGSALRSYLADRPLFSVEKKRDHGDRVLQYELENRLLRSQVELAKEWVLQEKGIERRDHFEERLHGQGTFLMAQVIYRIPTSWGHSFWIDVGDEDNYRLGQQVISRNSPVVEGHALVGVIDYVGTKQSRVRLITDPGLNPAVRVDRGKCSQNEIHYAIEALEDRLEGRSDCLEVLAILKEKVKIEPEECFLAKGELRGCMTPFWHIQPLLQGVGFNYNYADKEGPARDLQSKLPLIQKGDHLITSGLDGVFPFGLSVAIVKRVAPLTEGSFAYEIEAIPTAHVSDLRQVFVLPVNGE